MAVTSMTIGKTSFCICRCMYTQWTEIKVNGMRTIYAGPGREFDESELIALADKALKGLRTV